MNIINIIDRICLLYDTPTEPQSHDAPVSLGNMHIKHIKNIKNIINISYMVCQMPCLLLKSDKK